MKITENLLRSAIYIETFTSEEASPSAATSFIVNHKNSLYLITNAHVVENISNYKIYLPAPDQVSGKAHNIAWAIDKVKTKEEWINHPSEDIAILPLEHIKELIDINVFGLLSSDEFINNEEITQLSPINSILVVGYPRRNFDRYNAMPITKGGILATPYRFDIQGKQQFLCDVLLDTGSSGSPVFANFGDDNIKLIGIIASGIIGNNNIIGKPIQSQSEGNEIQPILLYGNLILQSSSSIGISYCVKASAILELLNSFK